MSKAVRPFISYAHEDRDAATRLWRDLKLMGAEPWADFASLRGGEEWEVGIRRAIRASSHFLALLSTCSVDKRGYVQSELRQALQLLDEFPPGEIFVVPLRLDVAEPRHERLRALHRIDLFPDYPEGLSRLRESLGLADRDLPRRVGASEAGPSNSGGRLHYQSVHTEYVVHDHQGKLASVRNVQVVRATVPGIRELITRGIAGTGRAVDVKSNIGTTRIVSEGGVLTAYTTATTDIPTAHAITHVVSYVGIDCFTETSEAVAMNISRPLESCGLRVQLPRERPFRSTLALLVEPGGAEFEVPCEVSHDALAALATVQAPRVGARLVLRWSW